MTVVELTAIDTAVEARWLTLQNAPPSDGALDFDEDDLELPVSGEPVAPAPLVSSDPPEGMYSRIVVMPTDIREFYARKYGKAGTRIVYCNGAARIVKEVYEEVKAKFEALSAEVLAASRR